MAVEGYTEERLLHVSCGVRVSLARRALDDRAVLLKQVAGSQPEAAAYLRSELQILSGLQHPHVVALVDGGEDWLALERLTGWDLATVRAAGPLPPAAATQIIKDAAGGVSAAHAQRIVHRDLSPDNIFVTTDGVTKVLDFGIALSHFSARFTRTGAIRGKFGYMAPEQLDGGAAGPRADVFSLGVVFHELLTGRPLFERATAEETCAAVMNAVLLPPPGLPAALAGLLMRALHREATLRFPDAAAFGEAIPSGLDGPALAQQLRQHLPPPSVGSATLVPDGPVRTEARAAWMDALDKK